MAIFSLSAKVIQRSKGRSAVAAAAYRCGGVLHDDRTGLTHDYSAKSGVERTFIVGWEGDRQSLWNAAESAEKRKDGTTAREYVAALPLELDGDAHEALARRFANHLRSSFGIACDVALHYPMKDVDGVKMCINPHMHVLTTTRVCDGTELYQKSDLELSTADRKKKGIKKGRKQELIDIREAFAEMTNEELAKNGQSQRVSAKSLKAQGIDREPSIKHYNNPRRIALDNERKQRNAEKAAALLEYENALAEIVDAMLEEEQEEADFIESELERIAQEQKAERQASAQHESVNQKTEKQEPQKLTGFAKMRQALSRTESYMCEEHRCKLEEVEAYNAADKWLRSQQFATKDFEL